MNNRTKSLRLGLVPGLFLAFAALATFATQAKAQSLGSAETFAVLGGSAVTNTGPSLISGNVGVSPGSAITGFPPGMVINGGLHANDAIAMQAHADLAAAYTAFAGLPSPPANNLSGMDLGGLTLTPGVYRCDVAATWSSGTLTFDAQNVPTARFVIQIGTTLITPSNSAIVLINGADARNVYFQVGTSATLGSGSSFFGNILANAAITAVGGTNLTGRLLAVVEGVTLDTNNVTNPGLTPGGTPTPTPSPAQLVNLSTRMRVETGNSVGIGGFIITGTAPKQVLLRAIGPSLGGSGVPDPLADPMMELHGPAGFMTIINNNWRDTQAAAIQATGLAPTNDLESAILVTLNPGPYTAIVRGNNNTTGVALVEVYDLDLAAASKLANISTRAFVSTGANIMIAGFILGNNPGDDNVILRGIGPSLAGFGVPTVLADPTLELRDGNGALIRSNNDWMDDPIQAALITAAGLAPSNNLESGIAATLPPGPYTALLAGRNNGTGNGLAEVYDLGSGPPVPSATPGGTATPTATATATAGGTPPLATPTPSASPSPSAGPPCVENFDGVTAPALPAGWVASNPDPGDGILWVTSTTTPESAPNDAFIPDQDGISDKVLDRVNVTVNNASAVMSWRNNYNTEFSDGIFWDGYVLEISAPGIGGGAFLDFTDPLVGASCVTGCYTGEIDGTANNPLAGRMAWSGDSGGYIDTVINLGPNLVGQTITLRFRMGTDEAVAAPGVRIDNISILNASCQ